MSGLFSRLVQQHIGRPTSSIKPVKSPVFPMDSRGNTADHGKVSQIQQSSNLEDEPQSINTDASIDTNDNAAASLTSLVTGNELDITNSVHAVKRPLSNSSTSQSTVKVDTVQQPLISKNSDAQPVSSMSNGIDVIDQEASTTLPLPADSLLIKQVFNKHQLQPVSIHNKKTQPTLSAAQHSQAENQTTVNISIGQIDIRATQPEKNEKKSLARPNRIRSNTLEEYQQKRARGGR